MVRELTTTGYHVRVRAAPVLNVGPVRMDRARQLEAQHERCQDVARDILRHIHLVAHVDVVADSRSICSFCGALWTEADDSPHNGGCCKRDAELMAVSKGN